MDVKLNNLIGKIYDAALNPSLWEAVCLEASDYLKGTSGVMVMHDHANPTATLAVQTRMHEDVHRHYLEHYYIEKDIWYQLITTKSSQQSVVIGSELVTDRDLKKTDMYHEILEPTEGGRLLAYNTVNNQTESAAFTISRPMSASEFDDEDKKIMALLGEHVQRAYFIHRHHYSLSLTNSTTQETLNKINQAVITLNERGQIICANKQAEKILRDNDGIRCINKMLLINDYQQQKKFNTYLKEVINTSKGKGTNAGGAIQITRYSGKPRYQLTVTPLNYSDDSVLYQNTSACVFIHDPAEEKTVSETILCDLYQLSNAEAKLVHLLFQGLTPKQISENNNVKISTVRTQLHNIFAKTATTSQTELIKLIALGPATLVD